MEGSEYNTPEEDSQLPAEPAEESPIAPEWFAEVKPIAIPDPLKQEPMEPEETFSDEGVSPSKTFPCACGICKEYFSTIQDLSQHVSKMHNPVPCYDCNQVFRASDKHKCTGVKKTDAAAKPPGANPPASAAVKAEEAEMTLEDHLRKETAGGNATLEAKGRKKYLCKVCKASFLTIVEARKHARRYKDPPHQCDVCQELFHLERHLSAHAKKHKANLPCDYCDKVFTSASVLQRHAATHGRAVEEFLRFTCTDCGEIFTERGPFDAHRRMLDELHRCHYCPRGFRHNKDLYQHLLAHPEFCPHKCHLCEAAFKQKSDLKRHLFEHRQKAFECDFCNRRFTQKYTLRDHQMSHAPFRCHVCGALFPLHDDLERHMRAERHEYECNVCHRGFQHKRDLRAHLPEHADGAASV